MLVNGAPVEGLAISSVVGDVTPPVLDGRAPGGRGEILLGSRTMHRLGLTIGDRVTVGAQGVRQTVPARIVGRGVVPVTHQATRLGDGLVLTAEDFLDIGHTLGLEDFGLGNAFIRLKPGASRNAFQPRLVDVLAPGTEWDSKVYSVPTATPADIASFGGVRNLPALLAGLLALLAAATLAHVLVTAIRRRRHDLAILKTLGFVRRQVRRTVGVQATALALAGVTVGIPAGVVVGRAVWSAFAGDLGIVVVPVVPLAAVLLCVPATLLLANLIAVVPGRVAARLAPARVLRAE
jgi:ABC-type lipoprotein release transport system permease subunit